MGTANINTTTTSHATSQPDSTNRPIAVIELFQSQGCNSCPPSNANVINLACPTASNSKSLAPLPTDGEVDYLLLTHHVTYWDYLGWTDTFGTHTSDRRQRDYVHRMHLRSAFTPQVVVNGRASGVGNSPSDLARLLKQGGAGDDWPVKVSVVRDEDWIVTVDARDVHSNQTLDVILVQFDQDYKEVKIRSGENAGETLPHLNVVKDVGSLGQVAAGEERVLVSDRRRLKDGLAAALLVQDGAGGPIVGATRLS